MKYKVTGFVQFFKGIYCIELNFKLNNCNSVHRILERGNKLLYDHVKANFTRNNIQNIAIWSFFSGTKKWVNITPPDPALAGLEDRSLARKEQLLSLHKCLGEKVSEIEKLKKENAGQKSVKLCNFIEDNPYTTFLYEGFHYSGRHLMAVLKKSFPYYHENIVRIDRELHTAHFDKYRNIFSIDDNTGISIANLCKEREDENK